MQLFIYLICIAAHLTGQWLFKLKSEGLNRDQTTNIDNRNLLFQNHNKNKLALSFLMEINMLLKSCTLKYKILFLATTPVLLCKNYTLRWKPNSNSHYLIWLSSTIFKYLETSLWGRLQFLHFTITRRSIVFLTLIIKKTAPNRAEKPNFLPKSFSKLKCHRYCDDCKMNNIWGFLKWSAKYANTNKAVMVHYVFGISDFQAEC